MTPTTIHVNLDQRGYDIVITRDDLAGLGPFARQRSRGTSAVLITDENVEKLANGVLASLRAASFQTSLAVLPPGEMQKSLHVASTLYDRLADIPADRRTLVVAVGGGVIGDLAGFVAATFARGLPLVMAPTTLLAMVDSSVGGKVGVNHPKAKNLIGSFHQPVGVWIDIAALNTLPDREFRSGLAEVAKYGVILDAELFAYLEKNADAILEREPEALRHLVARCCRLKADVVEKDEREETGLRAILNYGHTFAHAFETVAGYGHWLHGEAVSAGMICASRLAERRGLIPSELTQRQQNLLARFGLPIAPEPWSIDELMAVMRQDKKSRDGKLRLILPKRLGEAALFDHVKEDEVRKILQETCG
ncbi:MAG TPA: 3-dehydroquinate synthase [Gemmataceae bacterium]|jgi:3-dehydroquinate synthase|nr:3-dehydroquinate synthase [Gemmataceae bacterium]